MQVLPVEMLFAGQGVWYRFQSSPRPEITEERDIFRVSKQEDPTYGVLYVKTQLAESSKETLKTFLRLKAIKTSFHTLAELTLLKRSWMPCLFSQTFFDILIPFFRSPQVSPSSPGRLKDREQDCQTLSSD